MPRVRTPQGYTRAQREVLQRFSRAFIFLTQQLSGGEPPPPPNRLRHIRVPGYHRPVSPSRDQSEPPSKLEPFGFSDSQLNDCSILIVDDNEQNLELLQAYLEELGVTISTARNGVEAVAAVQSSPPDLVLLDVMMPVMSGFQAFAKIKADPKTRDIPIVMVTALNEVGDVERAVESGADDFLTKPVQKFELLTRARSLLRFRQMKRENDRILAELRRLRGEG